MHHIADDLMILGGAFLICGVIARIGVPVGLPTIPLFVLAGVVMGPETGGFDLVADPVQLELIAKLGLVFLLFYLGLEFSLDELTNGGKRLFAAATAYLVLNVGGGIVFGLSLGWGLAEAFVVAGIVGISSSAIVTKLLVDTKRLGNPETRTILGIIVIEDIFLAFYLVLLQPVLGGASGLAEALTGIGVAFAFLIALGLVARFGSPVVAKVIDTKDEEIVVVFFVGLAILTAGFAESLGVSDAIGAFMVGLILGSTAKAHRLRDLTHPLRDAFGAIFFFHFGLSIDPAAVLDVAPQVAAAVAATIVLTLAAGLVAARLHHFDRTQAANIGLTVLTRGEFSLVLAALALGAGLDERVGSLAAGYVLVLAIVGPTAVLASNKIARIIPRRLLRPAAPQDQTPALELESGSSWLYELGAEMLQVRVTPGSRLHGVAVCELRLPVGATPGLLLRKGSTSSLAHTTQLRTDDVILVVTGRAHRTSAERRLRAIHRNGRLAAWHGDDGT